MMFPNETVGADPGLSLANYTRPALIVTHLRERETAGVIKELSQLLHRGGCVPEVLPFYNEALNREFLVNTATENGFAFPHARLSGVTQMAFALGRSRHPLVWGSKGSLPVNFVFLVAVPATDAAPYLQLLSGLGRLAAHPQWLRELHEADTSQELCRVLEHVKLRG
jgi:mannitol/fructose-specific phosphotransferase system IIA component (Ntr-type)